MYVQLDEVIRTLRLVRDPRWQKLLAEIPSTLQRRYIAAQSYSTSRQQNGPGADEAEDGDRGVTRDLRADDKNEFEIVDEEAIERYYSQGRFHLGRDEDFEDDLDIDLTEPGGRRGADGIPEGVDPADVLSEDEFYALLGRKSAAPGAGMHRPG